MTQTERLRELLDERGVNHESLHSLTTKDISVTWAGDTCRWVALENPNNRLLAVAVYKDYLTAEQAVEATLGRGECRNKDRDYVGFWCSECDAHVSDEYLVGTDAEEFKYCPRCGAKVVDA